LIQNTTLSNPAYLIFAKQKSGSAGGNTAVANGDGIGTIEFHGNDGTNFVRCASISGAAVGTVSAGTVPGVITFATTASGSSLTERMRITSAGNVGIGTSSPAVKLSVATGTIPSTASSQAAAFYVATDNPSSLGSVGFFGADNNVGGPALNGFKARGTNASPTAANADDTMFNIGGYAWDTTSSSAYKLGASITLKRASGTGGVRVPGYIAFSTSSDASTTAERMRIGSSGIIDTLSSSTANTLSLRNTNSASTSINLITGSHSATSISGGTLCFIVRTNGNVLNTNNSYGAISDAKLKENVVDATPKLDKLNQVRVVNYNLKDNPDQKLLGVVAQELEQIFPGMVDESPDRDEEGNDLGTTTKSVKYSVFVPMLIKAIQEQQAIINDLKARLDAANL
jgi:hypothetical protein